MWKVDMSRQKSTFGHPKVFHYTDADDTYSTYLSSRKGNDIDCPY